MLIASLVGFQESAIAYRNFVLCTSDEKRVNLSDPNLERPSQVSSDLANGSNAVI